MQVSTFSLPYVYRSGTWYLVQETDHACIINLLDFWHCYSLAGLHSGDKLLCSGTGIRWFQVPGFQYRYRNSNLPVPGSMYDEYRYPSSTRQSAIMVPGTGTLGPGATARSTRYSPSTSSRWLCVSGVTQQYQVLYSLVGDIPVLEVAFWITPCFCKILVRCFTCDV